MEGRKNCPAVLKQNWCGGPRHSAAKHSLCGEAAFALATSGSTAWGKLPHFCASVPHLLPGPDRGLSSHRVEE